MSDMDASSSSTASSFANISNPSESQPSIIEHPQESRNNGENEDEMMDDLPSPSEPDSDDGVTISDDDDDDYNQEESDAEREWKESVQQLELLLSMVIVPYLGKYFGRKFAYWGWKQYMEWQYPVEVVVTNKAAFRGAGIVGVAASL